MGSSGLKLDAVLRQHGVDVSRLEILIVPPEILLRITDPEAPGYDPRVCDPATDDGVAQMEAATALGTVPPLLVRRNGCVVGGDDPALEIVDGRDRHINACEANRRRARAGKPPLRLPIRVVPVDDSLLALVALAANASKPETVATKAAKIRTARRQGRSAAEIGRAIKMSSKTVEAYLALDDLAPEARAAFEAGQLPMNAAPELLKLPRVKQAAAVEKIVADGATRKSGVRERVAAAREGRAPRQVGKKMLSRASVEKLRAVLALRVPQGDAKYVVAVVDFVLGNRDALVETFPELHEALVEAGVVAAAREAA